MSNNIMNQKQKKMTTVNIILLITTILTALITGLFYGYSCSVNLGLGRLPDGEYLAAMQSINKEILNPLFFASFLGTLVLLPLTTYLHRGQPVSSQFTLLLIATLIYAIGVIGITFFGNVPLNDTLAKVNLHSASIEEIASQRVKFEMPWNKLHTIRTIASLVSLILVIIACITKSGITETKY